jgi:hypothetical protein
LGTFSRHFSSSAFIKKFSKNASSAFIARFLARVLNVGRRRSRRRYRHNRNHHHRYDALSFEVNKKDDGVENERRKEQTDFINRSRVERF